MRFCAIHGAKGCASMRFCAIHGAKGCASMRFCAIRKQGSIVSTIKLGREIENWG